MLRAKGFLPSCRAYLTLNPRLSTTRLAFPSDRSMPPDGNTNFGRNADQILDQMCEHGPGRVAFMRSGIRRALHHTVSSSSVRGRVISTANAARARAASGSAPRSA
jgi:hypothetical protein